MPAVAQAPFDAAAGNRLAKRNALVLAVGQALAGGNSTVVTATGSILGAMLAPDKSLATLPLSVVVVGTWVGTLPVGFLVRRFGRRSAYQIGAAVGCLAGLIGYVAVIEGSFATYLAATFCAGLYQASHLSYRFAAADTASADFKGKAVSWVLAGGLFAAFLGPQLVILTKDLVPPYLFAASYLGQAATAVCAMLVISLVRTPRQVAPRPATAGRSLSEIARQPRFVVAATCGVASYALMNLMMTSAPLAMVDCGHSVDSAALGIQWHVLAMYAPSFVTGALVTRYGAAPVVAAGLTLLAVSAAVGFAGITVAHFWTALVLLGVGWNFGFVGATTMVLACYRPEERNKVQAFNDFLIFGTMALGSFASGAMLAYFGWYLVNLVMLPVVALAGAMLAWLVVRERPGLA
ncbi:MAG TPA: MFS transporter [Xanthobacteraceae bacterium]|nr:MFS transporter [Xanthobacteraceae bacterium]